MFENGLIETFQLLFSVTLQAESQDIQKVSNLLIDPRYQIEYQSWIDSNHSLLYEYH